MSNEFSPLRFEFQDCNEFLAGLDKEEHSSASSLYTPSPQEILNGSFQDDIPAGTYTNQVAGNEWNIDRMFEFTGGEYDNSSQSNNDDFTVDTSSQDHRNSANFNSLDFESINNGDSSSFSSPNSLINSSSSTSSDGETLSSAQYSAKPISHNGMPGYPLTPPYLQGTNITSVTNIPLDGQDDSPLNIKTEKPSSPPMSYKKEKGMMLHKRSSTGSVNTKNGKITKPRKEKTSHNMIEKRYRTNINDKILALRDCVPSLRCVVSGKGGNEDLEGLTPASKLNKATVLTKATEYIIHLQSRNNSLVQELEDLRNAVKGNGNGNGNGAVINGGQSSSIAANPNMMTPYQNNYSFDAYPRQPNNNGGAASKAMMVSMAGLMASGMMGGADDGSSRGLSALPIFAPLTSFKYGPLDFSSLIFGFKVSLIIGTLVYVLSPVFLSSSIPSEKQRQHTFSPVQLRKQTWLASSDALRLPSVDDVFGTAFSLLATMIEVMITVLVGADGYKILRQITGGSNSYDNLSGESLVRAIDCQLCGGDAECTDARIFSTFLYGFLAQPTTTRYMLQSLQAKVFSLGAPSILRGVANSSSKYMWALAQKMASKSDSEIPAHLLELLGRPDAFADGDNIQRLRNLAMNQPSSYRCVFQQADSGVETVGSDSGVISSLDAYASWYALRYVQAILSEYLNNDCVLSDGAMEKLEIAAKVSPLNSNAQRRVAVVKALLYGPTQPEYTLEAMECIRKNIEAAEAEQSIQQYEDSDSVSSLSEEEDDLSDDSDSTSVEEQSDNTKTHSSTFKKENPSIVTIDSRIALHCSFVLLYLARDDYEHGLQLASSLRVDPSAQIGLLSFVALFKMLKGIKELEVDSTALGKLEFLTAVARLWVGSEEAEAAGLSLEKRRELVGETVELSILYGGFEVEKVAQS